MHDEQQGPIQQSLDFVRGEQLRLLRDCNLPRTARDRTKHGVRAAALKSVLHAIDNFGRGRTGGAYASVRTLAATANLGPRTVTRAIAVLQELGLLCVSHDGPRCGHRGSPTNRYTIVWSELAVLVERQPSTACEQSAPDEKVLLPAPRSERPGDRSERPGDRSERPGDRSERPRGAQNDTTNDYEAHVKRRRNDVGEVGARSFDSGGGTFDPPADRYFAEDEITEIRSLANRLYKQAPARSPADRELLLKIATLWHDRELPEDAIHQVLESYVRAADQGKPIRNPMAWLWSTLRSQCQRFNLRLEFLLANTRFPSELLAPPTARAAANT